MSIHTPTPSTATPYKPNNQFTRPIKKTRKNVIPKQSWLQYNWIDKDPELDFVCYAIERSGLTIEQISDLTEQHGHRVGKYTIYGWLYRDTKKPQNVTLNMVMAVLGYERQWQERH